MKTRILPHEAGAPTEDAARRIYRVVLIVAASIFGGLLLFFLGRTAGVGALGETPWYLYVVAGIVLAAALWLGDRLKIAAFVAVTLLLFYVIYAYRSGLVEVGHTRPLLYIITLATIALMWKALAGASAGETRSAKILFIAVFILLGFSHFWTWEQFTSPSRWFASSTNNRVTLTSTPHRVDPKRALDIWLDGPTGCLFFKRAAWTNDSKPYGPHCKGEKDNPPLPRDIEWVWSASGALSGTIDQPPARYH